jgi:hypothetical protein
MLKSQAGYITDDRFAQILEKAWPSYQENVTTYLDYLERDPEENEITESQKIPFMCHHIRDLPAEAMVSELHKQQAIAKIRNSFLYAGTYMSVAGMLEREFKLKDTTAIKVKAARYYWLYVIGLYKMYEEFPSNFTVIQAMHREHPDWLVDDSKIN